MHWFLKEMKDKNQIVLKVKNTTDIIVNFQCMIKKYFKMKRTWEATLKRFMLEEKSTMRNFIKNMVGPARQKYEWLEKDLGSMSEENIDFICKKYVQFLKDVHVLRTYHFNVDFKGTPVTFETLEGASKFL